MGDEEQGRLCLAQGLRCTDQNAYSNDDGKITSNQMNAELNSTFDRLIEEVAAPIQSEVKSAVVHFVEDNLGAFRAADTKTIASEFVLVKK